MQKQFITLLFNHIIAYSSGSKSIGAALELPQLLLVALGVLPAANKTPHREIRGRRWAPAHLTRGPHQEEPGQLRALPSVHTIAKNLTV